MISLGEMQTLTVVKKTSAGVFLGTRDNPGEEVFMPGKLAPPEAKVSDDIEVFVYRDSEERLAATTRRPKIVLDEIALLKVQEVTKVGAFLDWGLPKDLLLPVSEQRTRVQEGKEYLVGLFLDKRKRLCATMRIYEFLRTDSPYKLDDRVTGIVYDTENDLGALVAVDRRYSGLIPKTELIGAVHIGMRIEARVTRIREDGKLALSLRERPAVQLGKDAEYILAKLKENGGVLHLNDESPPEAIRNQLGMSKGSFKKAVGRLLKEEAVKFIPGGIELLG